MQVVIPLVLKWSIDSGVAKNDTRVIVVGGLGFLGAVLVEYALRSGQSLATAVAVHRMIKTLRKHLITHILGLSAAFHDKSLSGAMVTRATGDFDNLSESLNMGVLTAVVDCAVLVGIVAGMFALSVPLALVAVATLPLLGWIIAAFSSALKKAMLKARRKIAVLNAYTQECLYGSATLKALTAETTASRKYDQLNHDYRKAQMESVVLDSLMFAVLDGISSIAIGFIFWLIAKRWFDDAHFSIGVIVAFALYMQQLFEPLKQLGNKMAMLQGAFTSIDRIFSILDEKQNNEGASTPPQLRGDICFSDVTFSYRGDDPNPVLKNVSFSVKGGESIAFVGATGSGKSTVIKLLTKLYTGYKGLITIDDIDLNTIDAQSLRHQIATVPQDIVLFDGTISFNIGLGLEGISQSDIERAAKVVQASNFIEKLPGGFNFVVREQGSNLSHGQRQLIAFARALARNPAIVVLDEATSSVDPECEQAIQSAIETILKDRSLIVIAHRLATIMKCNKIVVMGQGKILEMGAHQELLAKKGAYWDLHQRALET